MPLSRWEWWINCWGSWRFPLLPVWGGPPGKDVWLSSWLPWPRLSPVPSFWSAGESCLAGPVLPRPVFSTSAHRPVFRPGRRPDGEWSWRGGLKSHTCPEMTEKIYFCSAQGRKRRRAILPGPRGGAWVEFAPGSEECRPWVGSWVPGSGGVGWVAVSPL